MTMTTEQYEVLNITQQALRALMVALVAESTANPARLALLLDAAGADETLDESARAMLADLATGLRVMAQMQNDPPVAH